MRDSFVFYRSFAEAIEALDGENAKELMMAIFKYALEDTEPEIEDPVIKAMFSLMKPQLEINKKRYENAKKGGRPKKNENQTETETKPNENQTETETKPNENQTETKKNQTETKTKPNDEKSKPNVNVNVNDNVNVNNNNNILSHSSQNELQTFVKVWNEHAEKYGLPKVKELTNKRKKKLKSRLKDNPDFLKDFEKALKQVEYSSFLKGKKNGWKMDFDWLITNDTNYVRVIEGKYKDPESEETYEEPLYHL
jgi:hypothetical protein